jgi:hypothetical protein
VVLQHSLQILHHLQVRTYRLLIVACLQTELAGLLISLQIFVWDFFFLIVITPLGTV